jgi:hypothetical protein
MGETANGRRGDFLGEVQILRNSHQFALPQEPLKLT